MGRQIAVDRIARVSELSPPLVSPLLTSRILQGAFLLLFGFATVLLVAIDPTTVTAPHYIGGTALVLAASSMLLLPEFRNPVYRPWMMIMPILDFVGFAAIRWEQTGGVTNPMVMMLALPAAWTGLVRSWPAIALLIPAVLIVIVPDVMHVSIGGTGTDADRALMLIAVFPVVMLLAAVVAREMAQLLADRQHELEEEQARKEIKARETERTRQLLDAVLDSLDAGVVILDADGKLLLMNRAIRESPILDGDGDPWTAFQSVRVYDIDKCSPIPTEQTTLAMVVRGETVSDRKLWIGSPGSAQRALSASGGPVRAADGTQVASVLLIKDITEFVRALSAKDAFIATVSHELRTPLTTISGFLELIIERDGLDSDVMEWLSIIERNVRRQRLVVQDLLSAASAHSAPLSLERRESDLARTVRDALIAVSLEADVKDISLHAQAESATGFFDPLRMAQVVENLLSNAIRYTPSGGSVQVATEVDSESLILTVTDTGAGIASDDQEKVFDSFFRADSARASSIRGVGLGLTVVRDVVAAHGGTVTIKSPPGEGTTVTVRLPRGDGRGSGEQKERGDGGI